MKSIAKAERSGFLARGNQLQNKLLVVLALLIIYRIGTYITIPGINAHELQKFSAAHAGGVLGMLNMFTGGAVSRMSIFALNIMPYITASIIMQLMTMISTEMAAFKKDGESGRKKINQYTRYLTVILATIQGYGISVGILNIEFEGVRLVEISSLLFLITSTISLVGGTVFVMWLGEKITSDGIGNGASLIIFTGIVSGFPSGVAAFFEMGRTGALSASMIIFITLMAFGLIYLIVFFEKAQRKIVVQYPKRQIGNKIYGGDSSHLPIKLNIAGVIPPIFASSILLFPLTISNFSQASNVSWFTQFIMQNLNHGKPLYMLLYIIFIVFFSFFYSSIVFNAEETADNLRKNGGVVLGYRPGKQTAEYFNYVLTRLTVIGAAYISFICILPEVLISHYAIPFYLGGTSLLIIVNVVMDIFSQIQAHLLASQYEGLLKKTRLRGN